MAGGIQFGMSEIALGKRASVSDQLAHGSPSEAASRKPAAFEIFSMKISTLKFLSYEFFIDPFFCQLRMPPFAVTDVVQTDIADGSPHQVYSCRSLRHGTGTANDHSHPLCQAQRFVRFCCYVPKL